MTIRMHCPRIYFFPLLLQTVLVNNFIDVLTAQLVDSCNLVMLHYHWFNQIYYGVPCCGIIVKITFRCGDEVAVTKVMTPNSYIILLVCYSLQINIDIRILEYIGTLMWCLWKKAIDFNVNLFLSTSIKMSSTTDLPICLWKGSMHLTN